MAFDLDQTNTVEQSEEGYEFELKLPDGKPTGAFLKVRGDYSPTVRNFVKKKISEYQIKAKVAERKGKDVETTPDDVEDENRESAVIRVISWKGFVKGGKEQPFSKEAVEEFLKRNPWAISVIMEESSNLSNFLN